MTVSTIQCIHSFIYLGSFLLHWACHWTAVCLVHTVQWPKSCYSIESALWAQKPDAVVADRNEKKVQHFCPAALWLVSWLAIVSEQMLIRLTVNQKSGRERRKWVLPALALWHNLINNFVSRWTLSNPVQKTEFNWKQRQSLSKRISVCLINPLGFKKFLPSCCCHNSANK